ncbi:MAG: DUF1573 domain-containing protein [Planctomycetaceae bacterium]|jgi:hypothetical protein|nr:DUF1573 domain-containing protein [Planctomycetaceae bacterium]
MSFRLTSIILFLFIFLIGCSTNINENKKTDNGKYPELEIEGGTLQHLGRFESGQTIKKSISIKNISDVPLVFDERIDTSCSCLSSSLSSYKVASGESISLEVAIEVPQVIADNAVVMVKLRLIKPTRKYVVLLLEYATLLKWSIEPKEIIMTGYAGDQFVKKFYFLQKSEKSAIVDSVQFNGFNFVAQNPKKINDGVWEINFAGNFPEEPDRHIGEIKVTSGDKTEQINILCYVRPRLTSIPSKVYVYLPTNKSDQQLKIVRTICVLANQQFSIESVKMQKTGPETTDVKWNLSEQLNDNAQNDENAQYITVEINQTIDITKRHTLEIKIKTQDSTKLLSIPIIFVYE